MNKTALQKIKKAGYKTFSDLDKKLMKDSQYMTAWKEYEPYHHIFSALMKHRQERGLTQVDLAKKLGTKQSSISRFESGKSDSPFSFVQKIAHALDLEIIVQPKTK